MTRKDYILIAEALKRAWNTEAESAFPGVQAAARNLAESLARDNPRFDRERFLKAAGVQS
jgi:hypothetical protein